MVDDERRFRPDGARSRPVRGLPGDTASSQGQQGGGSFSRDEPETDTSLAPVIPLFGSRRTTAPNGGDAAALNQPIRTGSTSESSGRSLEDDADPPADTDWHTTWVQAGRSAHPSSGSSSHAGDLARTGATVSHLNGRVTSAHTPHDAAATDELGDDEVREKAEQALLRKLRSRSLSLAESRSVVRGIDGAGDALADDLVDHFVDLGYLDDAVLAEQLALSGVEKRGQGRRAIIQTLLQRGIPRDVAETAVASLPDDDDERAVEFARGKVRSIVGLEYDVALRRLAGQLARRGYSSSVALSAAKTALAENGVGRRRPSNGRPAGVRFTPDD